MKKILCLTDEAFSYLTKLLSENYDNGQGRNDLGGEVLFGPRRNAAVVNSIMDTLVDHADSFLHEYGPRPSETWEEYEAQALSPARRLARICDADETNIKLNREA